MWTILRGVPARFTTSYRHFKGTDTFIEKPDEDLRNKPLRRGDLGLPEAHAPARTHLFEELGVDVDAGVGGGRRQLDRPRWVHRVDLHVKRVQLLGREHVVPGGAQLEQGLSSVFVHLQTEDSAWSTATNKKQTSHCAQLLVHFKTSAKVLKPPSSFH